MKAIDQMDIKGKLQIVVRNQDDKIVQTISKNNSIVNTGRMLVAQLFKGEEQADQRPASISHIAVGTGLEQGQDEVNPDETSLQGEEVGRKAIATKEVTIVDGRARVTLTTDFIGDEGNGVLREAALFNGDVDAADAVMYNRVFFPEVNKSGEFKLTLIWEILF